MKNTRMVAFIFSILVLANLSVALCSCSTTQQNSATTEEGYGGAGGSGGHGGHGGGGGGGR